MSLLNTLRFIASHPLTRTHRFRAFFRLLSWQIGSRLRPGPVTFYWIKGARFLVRRGETGLTGNIYVGLHEFEEMAFLLHFLRPGEHFVDVGANVGSFTILAGAVCGARVIAFEPIASTFGRLILNVKINELERTVRCCQNAVGSKAGRLRFTSDQDTTNHVLSAEEASEPSADVEVVTLDDSLAGDHPVLLKIDVEGFETEVLRGAKGVLANPSLRAIILELNGSGNRYGYDEALIPAELKRLSFEPVQYRPLKRLLLASDSQISQAQNMLFVRDLDFVRERLRSAPPIEVLGVRF